MMGSPIMARTEYFEIVAKSALNRVQHMGFNWSLNPYQGCFHSCVYCFARAHAKLADRDPGAGFSARVGVKANLPEVLRSEEHTSELQSPCNLVCRLLLEKKKNIS